MNTASRKFLLFAIAGSAGFVTDTAVLYLLKGAAGPYAARAVSFFLGVVTTWLINRSLAFKGQVGDVPIWREFLNYLGAMILGGAVNYAIFAALVAMVPFVADHLIVGVATGVAGGMMVNFVLADRLVFRKKPTP